MVKSYSTEMRLVRLNSGLCARYYPTLNKSFPAATGLESTFFISLFSKRSAVYLWVLVDHRVLSLQIKTEKTIKLCKSLFYTNNSLTQTFSFKNHTNFYFAKASKMSTF